MTKKVFWENPYLTELKTLITSVNKDEITVAQTIFYAFSGGQESDEGTIGTAKVLDARTCGTEIIYRLEENHNLTVGDEVWMKIDWKRRYQLMRLHFAAELVLELAYQNLDSIEKIGAHIAEDKSRIDFLWKENISKSFPLIKEKLQKLIDDHFDIISDFEDASLERRYWQIPGFAKVPCGGTHLKNTSEIGKVDLKRVNIGKGKERIEIYVLNEDDKG